MSKHPNYHQIVAAAADTTLPVWHWSTSSQGWMKTNASSLWYDQGDMRFAVGDKPTAPPQRMCTLAGACFPEPMRVAPKEGEQYWLVTQDGPWRQTWHALSCERAWLADHRCHATEEAARAHFEALRAKNLEAVRNAK